MFKSSTKTTCKEENGLTSIVQEFVWIGLNEHCCVERAYRLFAQRWTIHALPSLVQLGHDDVLGLLGGGLGREVDQQWFVLIW